MLKIKKHFRSLSFAKSSIQVCFIWNNANYLTLSNHLDCVTKHSEGLSDYYRHIKRTEKLPMPPHSFTECKQKKNIHDAVEQCYLNLVPFNIQSTHAKIANQCTLSMCLSITNMWFGKQASVQWCWGSYLVLGRQD